VTYILVERNVRQITDLLDLRAGQTERAEVPEDEVVVRAIGLKLVALGGELGSDGPAVGDDLGSVLLESGGSDLLEGDGDTGDGVVVGSTLASGEDGVVDALRDIVRQRGRKKRKGETMNLLDVGLLGLVEEDKTGTGTTKGLVGGRADDVAELEGVVLNLSGDESRDVGHVHHEVRAVEVGDLTHASVVEVARVRGGTADDDPGLEEDGVLLQSIVVDETSRGVDLVRERLEVDGRGRDLALGGVSTVSEVTSVSETKAHDAVLGLNESGEGGEVGGRASATKEDDVSVCGAKKRQ
jgi:hypothetical protein